jgi:hypothetical protein
MGNFLFAANLPVRPRHLSKEGQPIYDGNSIVWLKEEVDMTQFAGQEIFIGIRLVSDDLENRNGINIDDIELITYQTTIIRVKLLHHNLPKSILTLQKANFISPSMLKNNGW